MEHLREKWAESEIVWISALEHWSYCPRQCALIHVEQTFSENLYTLRGRDVHEQVDEASSRLEEGVHVERALPLWSTRLGLLGKADVVEFHNRIPYPVEYKSGKRRRWGHERLQLCAQAICLEEMFSVDVTCGAIFYHGSRGRMEVQFTPESREEVEEATFAVRKMLSARVLPPPVNDARCKECSLIDSCLPSMVANNSSISDIKEILFTPSGG